MAEAHAMALPGKLDDAAAALALDVRKDEKGYRLMLQMCRPRRMEGDTPIWWDDEGRLDRLSAYCKQDVLTEVAIEPRVLRLRPSEREMYWLDQQINDRGVAVDVAFCEKAAKVVEMALSKADKRMKIVTGGAVTACSQVKALTEWLRDYGLPVDSVDKESLEDLLALELPPECEEALLLRQSAAKTSTAKLKAVRARTNRDGRMRGNLQYHGAGTGRWAARGAQLQNLPRPSILKAEDELGALQQRRAIEAIGWSADHGNIEVIEDLYGSPLNLVSDTLRGTVFAGRGNVLRVVDFSNIEGRGIAWLAGETPKLQAFKAFDDGSGADLYLVSASGTFGCTVEEAKPYRQIGKVSELSLGYQGGPVAFAKMAKNYKFRIINAYDTVWGVASEDRRAAALSGWAKRGKATGMAEKAWLTAEVIKLGWREAHPAIVEYWYALQRAALEAVSTGELRVVGPSGASVQYRKSGSFLFCRLPSGRAICYPFPRLEMVKRKITRDDGSVIERNEQRLIYKAKGKLNGKWGDKAFYGGLAAENVTQAVARDVMAEAMLRVEQAGYPIVLTVHDEIVSEAPKGFGSFEEFKRLMTVPPAWAKGFPIAAAGWEGDRYRKG